MQYQIITPSPSNSVTTYSLYGLYTGLAKSAQKLQQRYTFSIKGLMDENGNSRNTNFNNFGMNAMKIHIIIEQ